MGVAYGVEFMVVLNYVCQFIGNTVTIIVIFLIVRQFERRLPIEKAQSTVEIIVDWKLAFLRLTTSQLLSPVAGAWALMLVNATGGGWIHLRSDGWWFLPSFIVLILSIDLWAYLVHRAQHKFSLLWAMHSLHHSAEALSVVTGARHFWLEDPIISAGFPVLGIVFNIPQEMVTPMVLLYFLAGDGMAHLNMRVSLGRLALILNNPQYHRIHHSVEPQHWNKNFCKLFPLFDVIFGTAWKPGQDEFPITGLVSREKAAGILDGLIWPFRRRVPWVIGRKAEGVIPDSSLSANWFFEVAADPLESGEPKVRRINVSCVFWQKRLIDADRPPSGGPT